MQDGGTGGRVRPAAQPARRRWLWFLTTQAGIAAVAAIMLPTVARLGVQTACALVGAVVAGLGRDRPARRVPWSLLLLVVVPALLLRMVGGWLHVAGVLRELPPFAPLYLLTFAACAVALLLLRPRGGPGSTWLGMTEAGIIACSAVVLWWALLAEPLVTDEGRLPERLYQAVAPVLDLTLLAMGLRLALVGGRRSMSDVLVALCTAALLVGDTAYFFARSQGDDPLASQLSQVCWWVAAALIGAAALHPSTASGPEPDAVTEPGAPVEAAPDGTAPQEQPGGVALRLWAFAPVLAPAVTAASLLHEVARGDIDALDVAVPLGASTVAAALVVLRLHQVDRVARRRAVDLQQRTAALQEALRNEAELQREMRHRALHDPLTGLPNRLLLYERIDEALHRRATGAVLVAGLDAFKDVNERFGHSVGDEVLTAVADRIAALLGPADLLARPGGDEFIVLLTDVGPRTAQRRGDALVAALRRPVSTRGHELYATVSVGLRLLDPAARTADVLRDADLARYAAKAAGRDQLVVYTDALREERLAKTRTVERLRAAVDHDELRVFYQPMVRLADGRFQAVEALARWQPPGRPLVLPDRFIPAAEDSGLIVEIGEWVLRRACRDAAPWYARHGTLVSVNVSPRQLREPDFVDVVRRALTDAALPAAALILEITEGVLVASGTQTEQAIAHLSRLRLDGVRVAVDDFGTGYSSLAYLRDLPIDLVKIDKSFLPSETVDAAQHTVLVRAIIDLATGLGLGTVAEGVELQEQADLLRELGCERAQGFLFARPAPAGEVSALLAGTARDAVTAV